MAACLPALSAAACGTGHGSPGADQAASARQAGSGDDALGGLVAGMVVAALLMAASCALGITKRIAEYRLAARLATVVRPAGNRVIGR